MMLLLNLRSCINFGNSIDLSLYFILFGVSIFMKVHELIKILKTCDGNAEVIIAKEPDGINHSPISWNIDKSIKYVKKNKYTGTINIYDTKLANPDEYYDPDLYYSALEYGSDAIVLYPIN